MNPTFSEMVLIPGGVFTMGSNEGYINEQPKHEVKIRPFFLDVRVVTNSEFQLFVRNNQQFLKTKISRKIADKNYLNQWNEDECPEELLNRSVINVSAYVAEAFAKWVGKRLPTESEWEYAAGGIENYTWGNHSEFEDKNYICFRDGGHPIGFIPKTCPANSFGLFDMSGIGWEWLQDAYEIDYYSKSPFFNPVNMNLSDDRVLRGGSAYLDNPKYMRIHVRGRNNPTACNEDYGFRCAKDVVEL